MIKGRVMEETNHESIESVDKYRHLFEQSPIGIYVTDQQGIILDANLACRALLGYGTLFDLWWQ